METIITVLIFVGYVLALIICLTAVKGGVWITVNSYKSRQRTKDEASLEHPESGWKFHIKASSGILLAIAGLTGCCFIVYYYYQALIAIFALVVLSCGNMLSLGMAGRGFEIKTKTSKKKHR